jgi:hypothetical protein
MIPYRINIRNTISRERFLIYYGCFIVTGCFVGWTIAFEIVNPLIAICFFPILFVLLKSVKNWRRGLMTVAVWFVIVDLIRNTLGGPKYFLIVSDGLVLFVFCVFLLQYYFFGKGGVGKYIPKKIQLLLVGFGCIVFIQSLNPWIPELILRVAGLRTYLFYIPAIALGIYALRSEDDLRRFYFFLFFLSIPVILLSFYQVASDQTKLGVPLVSMEHKVHSFGIYNVDLISATFASSKRYGRFLFLVYPFLYGISVYYNRSMKVKFGFFAIFAIANIASGAKEAVVMFVLFHAFFWLLNSKKQINNYVKICIIVLSAILLWNTILNFSGDTITDQNYRVKAILSNQEDWRNRVSIYLYEPFLNIAEGSSIFTTLFGHGVGTYGQELLLLGDQESVEYERMLYGGDSGVTKLIKELGVLGFFCFMIMYSIILKILWNSLTRLKNKKIFPVALSIFFIPVGWLILILKAHPVISDGMISFGLWFSIGIILALRYYAETGRFPVVAQGTSR